MNDVIDRFDLCQHARIAEAFVLQANTSERWTFSTASALAGSRAKDVQDCRSCRRRILKSGGVLQRS